MYFTEYFHGHSLPLHNNDEFRPQIIVIIYMPPIIAAIIGSWEKSPPATASAKPEIIPNPIAHSSSEAPSMPSKNSPPPFFSAHASTSSKLITPSPSVSSSLNISSNPALISASSFGIESDSPH